VGAMSGYLQGEKFEGLRTKWIKCVGWLQGPDPPFPAWPFVASEPIPLGAGCRCAFADQDLFKRPKTRPSDRAQGSGLLWRKQNAPGMLCASERSRDERS